MAAWRSNAFLLATILATLTCRPAISAASRMEALPAIMLWAWESQQDLRFLDTRRAGAAYLAATLWLSGDAVAVRPRRQPLRTPPGTALIAVVRIEIPPHHSPLLSGQQRARAAAEILRIAGRQDSPGVQIDFDARISQRPFYLDLLNDLRRGLPAESGLSITALASWLLGDRWLDQAPVDEIVPMFFRMGAERRLIQQLLRKGLIFPKMQPVISAGLSTDEPLASLPHTKRRYVFHPGPWTAGEFEKLLEEVAP